MKIPNLVYSTTLLFISNFIVRIIGFLYKIFLSRKIGAGGLGIFHIIFHFLMLCVSITTTGIPVALNSLISKEKSLNNKHNINVLFISTLYLSFFISIFISVFVSLNSKFISLKLLHSPNYQIFILSITPAISLITISNILRSYYYGLKKVEVPAVGQILEQISRILFVVFIFSYIKNASLYSLIPLIGLSVGEIINILFVTINLTKEPNLKNNYVIGLRDFFIGISKISKIAFPITFNRVFTVIIQSISSILIPSRLVLSGLKYTNAMNIYGTITGMVFPFLFLPFTVTSALVVNLIPSISQEIPKKNYKLINKKIFFSIFLSASIGFSASLIYMFFGEEICYFVYKSNLAGKYLKLISVSCFFMVLNHTLSGILHSIEKEYRATINNIIGLLVQLLCIYFLIPINNINIYGFIYGFIASSIIIFILHSITLIKAKKRWK
nr:oligosaccharide flippase family protein [Tepidibacter formicigenes]